MENNNTTMNGQQPTTPTPEASGGQGEKLFTQDEVNRIVSDRLARERAKSEPVVDEREAALQAREKALEARESRARCEDYLRGAGIYEKFHGKFLEALDTGDFEKFKAAVDALGDPYIAKVTTVGANTPNPPVNFDHSVDAQISAAFKPKI